jgi:glycine/D-amino acid oxidase-like deaminating enzyme|tara:strand:+ start:1050 stop:1355 length:306 start_codon:yes stop_codon:yes gene_type:complete
MKSHVQACVIGGGVVDCSVLYHLTKLGWTDVMLLERLELTSGSTWHAAGGFHTLNGDTNMAALQGYTIKPGTGDVELCRRPAGAPAGSAAALWRFIDGIQD